MFSRHKQLIIAASSCTWSLKAQTASISVITSRCSVSAANMISSYPGVLNFLKGMGHCNLTGLSVQKLTSVSLSGIDHQKCGLTGKICRQEEKKPLCCTLEAASLAVGHVRFGFLTDVLSPCLTYRADRSPTVFVSHTSLFPRGCFQLCNSLGRIRLFHAKISGADRSGTSYQSLSYNDNTDPTEDKQLALFISLSVTLSDR